MKLAEQIKNLAYERLEEAVILCNNGKFNGAFYLAGYSIELMLKAKVCEHLDVDNLFDEQCDIYGISEVRKAMKTHDVGVLLVFSGLRAKLEIAKSTNLLLTKMYSLLFASSGRCLWNEQVRYQPSGTYNSDDVQMFIGLLQHDEGLLKWIEKS
jgi:hypothetical protein